MASSDPFDAVEHAERDRIDAHEVSWALRACTRAATDVDYVLARRVGLRPMDYTALGHVLAYEGELSPHQLSARLGISTGSASELVDRLERAGHVVRHRSEVDRRRVSLRASSRAIEQILTELSPLLGALDAVANSFSHAEQSAISRYLREVTQAMRDYEDRVHSGPDGPGRKT